MRECGPFKETLSVCLRLRKSLLELEELRQDLFWRTGRRSDISLERSPIYLEFYRFRHTLLIYSRCIVYGRIIDRQNRADL